MAVWQVESSGGDNRVGTISFHLLNSHIPRAGFPSEIFGYINQFFLNATSKDRELVLAIFSYKNHTSAFSFQM